MPHLNLNKKVFLTIDHNEEGIIDVSDSGLPKVE